MNTKTLENTLVENNSPTATLHSLKVETHERRRVIEDQGILLASLSDSEKG